MANAAHEHPATHGGLFVLHETADILHPHGETSHTEYGLTFLAHGWFRMEHGTEIRVDPGSVVLMPAGVPHRPIEGADLEYWLVGFCPSCVHMDETHILMEPFRRVRSGSLPVVSMPRDRQRRLVRLIKELDRESRRHSPESPELARSLLLLLLGEVYRALPSRLGIAESGDSLVSSALAFIQKNCLNPISLRDVAAAVHRTPAHVASTVKKSTGHSVGTWINAGRLGEAASRLLHTQDSLDEIANHVGWQDKTHFIRQFRKAYGATPAAWRRENATAHDHGAH